MAKVLLFAFLVFLPAPHAEASFAGACWRWVTQIGYRTYEESKSYWKRVFHLASDQKVMSARRKIISIGATAVRQTIKVSYAPIFFYIDLWQQPFSVIRKEEEGIHRDRLDRVQRLAAGFFSAIPRNLAHLSLYFALLQGGINVPLEILEQEQVTTFPDYATVTSARRTFSPGEVQVIVGPPQGRDAGLDIMIALWEAMWKKQITEKGARGMAMEVIRSDDLGEILDRIGTLRAKGQIKDIFFLYHSSAGRMSLNADSFADEQVRRIFRFYESERGHVLDENAIRQEYAEKIDKWPKDLISSDARLLLYGCSVLKGERGDGLAVACHQHILQGKGHVAGATRTLNLPFELPRSQNWQDVARLHLYELPPLTAGYQWFGVAPLYHAMFDDEPAVKRYPLKDPDPLEFLFEGE